MFDKTQFRLILEKAKGDRKIVEFTEDSGVNRTYISKYLNEKLDRPPSPEIIKQLASAANNGVTYEELMEAAGHIPKGEPNTTPNPYLPELPENLLFKIDSRAKKQYKEFMMKAGENFFYNDEYDEEDKQQLMEVLMRAFIRSKEEAKKRYGRKKKSENDN